MNARSWLLPVMICAAAAAAACQETAPPPPKVAVAPPPPDADGDGIPDDGRDRCLDEKEDGLPPKPSDGCRSSDADGDGIADDGTDHCLQEKEDGLEPDPKDGCKTTDADHDGVANAADKCPEQPETKNDFEDDDGCPDTVPRVRVTKSEVRISEKILFAFKKATIEKESDGLLDEIATVLDHNPQIEFIEVAGHADKIGADASNVLLTQQRSRAVLEALAKRGIDRKRMRPQGYGRYCPVDPGDSDAAREKNRRVEFKILRIDGVETGVALGCAEALAKGLHPARVPPTAPHREEIVQATEKRGPLKLFGEPPGAKPTGAAAVAAAKAPVDPKKPAMKPAGATKPASVTKPTTGKAPGSKAPAAKPKPGKSTPAAAKKPGAKT